MYTSFHWEEEKILGNISSSLPFIIFFPVLLTAGRGCLLCSFLPLSVGFHSANVLGLKFEGLELYKSSLFGVVSYDEFHVPYLF